MKGVKFNDIHSHKDLNLVLSSVSIPPAQPKTNFIDIEGADGSLDLTEALGEVKYKDRNCEFVFSVFPTDDFEDKKTEVSNLLNGQVCKITLDKDADYFYFGRCIVDNYKSNKLLRQITVKATVQPYKHKQDETEVIVRFCGKNLFNTSAIPLGEESDVYNYVSSVGEGSITITSNKEYKGNGYKYLGVILKDVCPLMTAGTKYTLTANSTASNKSIYLQEANRMWLFDETIIVDETMLNSKVVFYGFNPANNGYGDCVISNIQIEEGEIATEYEAYTPITQKEVVLLNSRKTVTPTITCSAETTITIDGNEYVLGEGTHKVLDVQLKQGTTELTVAGSGTLTFKYQEGDL